MNTLAQKQLITFDDKVVRQFMWASIIWGIVGMLVGVIIASQLNFHQLNVTQWLSFGRLRPLHTNAVIFAFVGNMMFSGIYYSTQRLCKARMASDILSKIHFWGWQGIIVAAAITLPLGYTRGQEYAELIWPINIAVALIWVVFAVNFFWTLARRNEPSLYVALWFYIATIITVAMLYIVNHLSIPTSWTHSYTLFSGVQNALVQWWYGHNAVAFFLTTPILGIMYYFLPKAVERPVYSYRLSIVHFWSLVFIYIWAGPHHLLNTSLPKWLQMLGMFFSLMLWAPSWGGMLNGLLTLRGAWDKLRTDPVVKFFIAAVTFYGMSTFEGPLLSIRAVNALSHYSDWTIGHVHSGALGWNGLMAAGMFYWLTPRLYGTKLHSVPMANFHFWISIVGILLYVAAMWVSGIMQGLMLNSTNAAGTALTYPNFIETLTAIRPMMAFRIIGGSMYLVGMGLMLWNLWKTARSGQPVNETREVAILERNSVDNMGVKDTFLSDPVTYFFGGLFLLMGWIFLPKGADITALVCALIFGAIAVRKFTTSHHTWSQWYERLLENWLPFTILTFIAVALGGLIQIIPTVMVNRAKNMEDRIQQVYTPLELTGRDIYVSEGCYNCHSQMIRTLLPDVLRYGDYSRLGESIYDHPFQWGSKRTGPDLAREGSRYPHSWHFNHMMDPRSTSVGSNMPAYPHLFTTKFDQKTLPKKIAAMVRLGVPYPAMTDLEIKENAIKQGIEIVEKLKEDKLTAAPDTQIVALIAYLQKLGKYDTLEVEDKLQKYPTAPGLIPGPVNPDQNRPAASSQE
ncbi:cytochrome c oxidase cbb3-type subunit I/II [Prosthecobacter fusiformis]|uniref:cytochrome-c oxidase n=1 Tax=Prosthecobacter fusiformis TaxID=48464 RepID=A0A4R7SRK2_9BACT|nr:cytochrome-c oxidase, cbb3-type subunit I [Prosthecobacter fusiformis]TDU81604.1 cytochrome c oxidase cbb3-type subunit I/II [Prosthecobacter fusiformis]